MPKRVVSETLRDGAVLRLALHAPPGNILDSGLIEDLSRALETAGRSPALKAILFEGSGRHFSYGASIEEHRPERVAALLGSFHGLFRRLAGIDRVLVAAVRGQCLGGGMELACFCHRVFAQPRARFAQPEISLGVFAPVASIILARRAGQAVADDICLTGRSLSASEALASGLVDQIAANPRKAAEDWIARRLLSKSAASLSIAVRAVRLQWNAGFLRDLEQVERLYLDDLMRTEDAREGVEAFLAKRRPVWKDR
jgi:cyclohexa-1,5-dienecarbonyl-CoA hydratase